MKVEAGLTSDEIAQVLIGYGVSGFISKVLLGVSGKPQKPYPPLANESYASPAMAAIPNDRYASPHVRCIQ